MMLTVGDKFPVFALQAVMADKSFAVLSNQDYEGTWKVFFAWPMDFTFVCPTEIAEFGIRNQDFIDRNAQVMGFSADTQYVHLAWREQHPALRDLAYPMLADTKRELSKTLGILDFTEGVPLRATFIVDPEWTIQWVSVNNLNVGRSVPEILRVLDALQTEALCPCNWERGRPTITLT